jgi:trans-aconitate 2-methyltransferase
MKDTWSPDQYDRFAAERKQPFLDLVAMIERRPGMRVVDLGCGDGTLTRELHHALNAKETLGIDRSASMLARASSDGAVTFRNQSIESWDEARDLVFSNAALHWIEDHEAFFSRIQRAQIAVQMPANFDHPSHTVAAEIGGPQAKNVLSPERYAEILHARGFKKQSVRLHVYAHELPSSRSVVEWTKGTLLTQYAARMTPEEYEAFLAAYEKRLLEVIGDRSPYLFTFKRILFWAQA